MSFGELLYLWEGDKKGTGRKFCSPPTPVTVAPMTFMSPCELQMFVHVSLYFPISCNPPAPTLSTFVLQFSSGAMVGVCKVSLQHSQ